MRPCGSSFRHLARIARTTVLLGCLSFFSFLQVGQGARLLADAFLQTGPRSQSTHALTSTPAGQDSESLSCDTSLGTCEAVLCDRRLRIPTFRSTRARSQHLPIRIFHGDARPVILRTRAVFCDFSLLRCVLHPHFRLLENSTTVLC